MEIQQKTMAINARAVALEMITLLGYILVLGVAVSVLIAAPVVLLYATTS